MANNREYQIDLATHPFCVAMKEQRINMGLSYRALAEKIGTASRSYLKELEDGKWVVSVELGMCICQVLSIPTYFCMDYIKLGTFQRTEQMITKQYTEWIDSMPDNVLEDMLKTQGDIMVHSAYYDKELV